MAKFDDLKKMREERDGKQAEVEQRADPEKIKEEQVRLAAGEAVGGEPPDADDDDDDDETPAVETATPNVDDETVHVSAHERKKPETKTDEVPVAPPGTEAVEIDGKTVYVAPELAAAFKEAEQGKQAAAKDAETDALADRVAERLKGKLPTATAPTAKTSAEIAAEKALADAEAVAIKHPEPSESLSVTDPAEYATQLKAHLKEQNERDTNRILLERDAKDAKAAREQQAVSDAQLEAQARETLGNQFYESYKVLADPATRKLVDVLLEQKWTEIKESLKRNPPKTKAEGDALKKKCFTEIAADATRQIFAIRQQGGNAAPPAPNPPTVVTSKQRDAGRKPTPQKEKPKEKYPSGSVSAMLAKHKDEKLKDKGATA